MIILMVYLVPLIVIKFCMYMHHFLVVKAYLTV